MPTGRTSVDDNHSHSYNVDDDGNSETGTTAGHQHIIVNWIVRVASGHSHTIQR